MWLCYFAALSQIHIFSVVCLTLSEKNEPVLSTTIYAAKQDEAGGPKCKWGRKYISIALEKMNGLWTILNRPEQG